MNIFKKTILSLVVVLGLVVAPVVLSSTAQAATPTPKESLCTGSGGTWNAGTSTCTNADSNGTLDGLFKTIVNILLYIIGAVSVIMIIIGGIRYVVSAGDQSSVTGAKNTIMYAVVGLVISIMAYAIVNFVLSSIK